MSNLFLSCSDPSTENSKPSRIRDLVLALCESLGSGGHRLVFGSHPTVTPHIQEAIETSKIAANQVHAHVLGCFPYTIFCDTTVYVGAKAEIPSTLQRMRKAMATEAENALFIGGKPSNESLTSRSGIQLEWEAHEKAHPNGIRLVSEVMGGAALELLSQGIVVPGNPDAALDQLGNQVVSYLK